MKRWKIAVSASIVIVLGVGGDPAFAGGKPTPLVAAGGRPIPAAVSFAAVGTPLPLATTDLSAAERTVEARSDYGGMWVSPGNRLVVNLVGAPDSAPSAAAAGAVRAAIPARAAIEVRTVSRTWKELLALYDRAIRERATLVAAGADVSEIAVRVRTNTVDVVVGLSSPADTEARVAADLGPAVTVTRAASSGAGGTNSRISPYPHVRAGLEIWSSDTSCTAGLHFINSLGQYYMLTAGHCGNRSWREGTSTGPSVGATHANHWANNTSCDCAAVGPISAGQATNVVYATPTTGQAITQAGGRKVGEQVCYSGASQISNPVKCGTLFDFPVSKHYTHPNVYDVNNLYDVLGNKTHPGDSGAPVYATFTALGIVSGAPDDPNNDHWWYVPISAALSAVNGRLLTTTP